MIQRGKGFCDWYTKSNGDDLAHEIVSMGYPSVDYLLPDLFVWLEDMNYPGAMEIAKFLVTVGEPLIPYLKEALVANADCRYNIISFVVRDLPSNIVKEIQEELMSIARSDSSESLVCLDILTSKELGHPNELMKYVLDQWIRYRALFEQADRIRSSEYLAPLHDLFDRIVNAKNINEKLAAFHDLIGYDGKQYREDSFVIKAIQNHQHKN